MVFQWNSKTALYHYIHGKNTERYQQTLSDKFFRLLRTVVDFIIQQQEINKELQRRQEEESVDIRWIGDRGLVKISGKGFTSAISTMQAKGSFEIVIKVSGTLSEEENDLVCCQDGKSASITLREIDTTGKNTSSVDNGKGI